MKQPQQPYVSFRAFRKTIDDRNMVSVLLMFMLGVLIGITIVGAVLGRHNIADYTVADQHYAQVFNQQPDRQELAQTLLTAHGRGLLGASDILDDSNYLKEMQHVAATGDKFSLPPEQPRSWSFVWIFSACVFGGWLLLAGTFLGALYAAHAADNKHYLADLPWRCRVWPWVFALLSPVLWVPLLVSRRKMKRADKRELAAIEIVR